MPEAALSIFDTLLTEYQATREVEMDFEEYLEECRRDQAFYATAAERLLKAIGTPTLIDYEKERNLGKIFENRDMVRYPGFEDFYGIEDVATRIVSFLRSSAQGGEEAKQILYLLGPVGGGKSSLAKRLTQLMEVEPFYAIKGSPVFDNPLSVFDARKHGKMVESRYHINPRYLQAALSPWALQQLKKNEGDPRKFKVVKLFPSRLGQQAISRVEPGDTNNMDISVLVGKVDMTKLEDGLSTHDPMAYGYSGGLNRGNRGMMEFVEMFKAPLTSLSPLLTCTQDAQYTGTEAIGALPFEGIVLAHSNESEWETFKNNKKNEALIDRCNTIKVPYTLRASAELEINKKYLRESDFGGHPCAPHTLEILAQFAVMTRITAPKSGSGLRTKMIVYDGEKPEDPKAATLRKYREEAVEVGAREGMSGYSVRSGRKALSAAFNLRANEKDGEIAADPIDLMYVLERQIDEGDLTAEERKRWKDDILAGIIKKEYSKAANAELKGALIESMQAHGQQLFENYVKYADMIADSDDDEFMDPATNTVILRKDIEAKLDQIEKPAAISNPKEFRREVVNFTLRKKLENKGQMPDWRAFQKFKDALEKKVFATIGELDPLISFDKKANQDAEKEHAAFVTRMLARGYTERQTRRLVKWFQVPANRPA